MYSEENEQLAEAAYNLWRDAHPSDPSWEAFAPKHLYRDLVLTYQRKPHIKLIPNEMEQCVIDAIQASKGDKNAVLK